MKVLNVMLSRGRGGLERAVIDAHEGLMRAGCDMLSVIPPASWIMQRFPQDWSRRYLRSFGNWDPMARLNLMRVAADFKPDVILTHGNRAVHAARMARRLAPVVVVSHTTNYSVLKALHLIDGAIALTSHYRQKLVDGGFAHAAIRLVPNAIRLGDEPPPPFQNGTPVIGALGRIAPNKGFDILVDACAKLAAKGVPFRCLIGGVDEDGQTHSLAAVRDAAGLSPDQFQLAGWISEPAAFLRSLDLFVMPSRREVLSIALLEALESGRPIVCTKVPGLEDVFTQGKEGLFVELEDAAGLADAIARILADPEKARTMGRAARDRARDFDIAAVGQQLRTALDGLAAAARQRGQ